jgi:alpha-beta hydrolase superfamily lysophospholipase
VHVASFDDWIEDVFAAVVWARAECGYDADAVPLFLFGESLGGLQVLEAALQSKFYGIVPKKHQLAGVICTGAVLQVNPDLLPPKPVLKILSWLAPYYPRLKMPNDARMNETYDAAFGDPEWARITRLDDKVLKAPQTTLAGAVGIIETGPLTAKQAATFPCPLLAIHAKGDKRVSIEPIQQFVDQIPREKVDAEGVWVDSNGHQLLQDQRHVTEPLMDKIASWILEHAEQH